MSDALVRIDDLAAGWLRAWTAEADFADCCAPDIQYEDPLAHDPLRGVDELSAHAQRLRAGFPDLRVERTGRALSEGTFAAIPWRVVATHRAGIGALPATNRFVSLHGLHYLELSDGRIRRARGFFDLYDAATQLGLLPTRGGLGESVLLLLRGFGLRT